MKNNIFKLTLSAMFLAMAMFLPFLTGQIQQIGSMLLPMHLPVLLCGIICGPYWGGMVGLIAPFLRYTMFGMPQMPTTLTMTFELLAYGIIIGLIYSKLPKKPISIFIALIGAMIGGRIVWGVVATVVYQIMGLDAFTFSMFVTSGFVSAIPGIIVQLILVPTIVLALTKAKVMPNDQVIA